MDPPPQLARTQKTMSNVLHKNENYEVTVAEGAYVLTNTVTKVVEDKGTHLPEIIIEAEQRNALLRYEVWGTLDAQIASQVEQATAWFNDEIEVELDLDDDVPGSKLLN